MKKYVFLPFVLIIIKVVISCGVSNRPVLSAYDNPYIHNPVNDTLVLLLPTYEGERCMIKIHENMVQMQAMETVVEGIARFDVSQVPAGKYILWIRVGDLFTGVWIEKR